MLALLRPLGADPFLLSYLATVLERCGRAAEAVTLLRTTIRDGNAFGNHVEQLADILARHDPAALADFVPNGGEHYAAERLALLYEELGRVDDAVELLAPFAAEDPDPAGVLAELLARHGRDEEALQVLRGAADLDPEWTRFPLAEKLAALGRHDEALAVLDRCDPDDAFLVRVGMLVAAGRTEAAIAALRGEPDAYRARCRLAEILRDAGRTAEAVEVLRPSGDEWDRALLAEILIGMGDPEAGVAAVR